MRRIEHTRARRRLAVQATLSAFLVASLAFGATRVVSTTPTGNDSLVEQPGPTASPAAKETAKPEQPKKAAKKKAPPPAAKSEAPDAPKPSYEPKPTYQPGPTEKPVEKPSDKPVEKPTEKPSDQPVANGLAAELWPYTDAVAGQSMDWKVKVYDTAGKLVRIELQYGDGTGTVYSPDEACGDGVAVKKFFSHTYAKAGTYTATAVVTTGGCGAPTETKTVRSSVKVVAAEQGNGPAKPTVTAEWDDGTLRLHGADADGFVKKFWVNWGDGSPETYVGPRPLDACEPGKPSAWDPTTSHSYAEPGTYTITVTVMSVNCEGGQGQTATTTLTLSV